MSDELTLNAYGWALTHWAQKGGNYYTMRKLVESCESKEELADKISKTTPLARYEATLLAKNLFDPIKHQIERDLKGKHHPVDKGMGL
jgi:hypothetical protein